MKSRFALLAMLVVAAAPLAAQGGGGGGGGMGGGRGFARGINNDSTMAALLGLSADQHTKYKATLDTYNTANMSLMTYMRGVQQDGGTPSADSMTKRTALRTKLTADLKALLTPAQATVFDSVVTATPQGRRGGGGGGGGI